MTNTSRTSSAFRGLARALLCLALAALAPLAWAQAGKYPTKTVKIVVGYGPGTTSDVFARLIANALTQRWGQTVIVDNKPGGSAVVAERALMAAPADGCPDREL